MAADANRFGEMTHHNTPDTSAPVYVSAFYRDTLTIVSLVYK